MKTFLTNKYVVIFLVLIGLDILFSLFLSLFPHKSTVNTQNPTTSNQIIPTSTIGRFLIKSTSIPSATGSAETTFYPDISISFPQPLSPSDQKKVKLTVSPDVGAAMGWDTNNNTAYLAFPNPLSPNTTYTVTATTPEKSYSWTINTPSEAVDQSSQPFRDTTWANSIKYNEAVFPWIDSLPIQGDGYFIYFSIDQKSFIGALYPKKNSPTTIQNQVNMLKKTVTTTVQNLGPSAKNYPISWDITPESE